MKLLLILLLAAPLASCRKDCGECGRITAKQIKASGGWQTPAGTKQMYFIVGADTVAIGLITWDRYQVGDQYCH